MTQLTLTWTQTEVLLKVLKDREAGLVNHIVYLEDDPTRELDADYDDLNAIRGIIRQCER